jgi:hypothetical protein
MVLAAIPFPVTTVTAFGKYFIVVSLTYEKLMLSDRLIHARFFVLVVKMHSRSQNALPIYRARERNSYAGVEAESIGAGLLVTPSLF